MARNRGEAMSTVGRYTILAAHLHQSRPDEMLSASDKLQKANANHPKLKNRFSGLSYCISLIQFWQRFLATI